MPNKGAAVSTAALFFCAAFTASAAAPPCGTAVIPNGIGQDNPGPVTSLNPLLGPTVPNLQAAILLYRPLVWLSPEDRMDPDASLVASITPMDGNTRLRLRLKPWRWSDGTPITSDDVRFGWERILALGDIWDYAGSGGLPERIRALETPAPDTVDLLLSTPTNPDWFTLNALPSLTPLPRHAWGEIGRDAMWRRQTDPTLFRVVDGPFLLEDFAPNRQISLIPNPLYGGPPARLARLVLDFGAGGSPLRALQSGRIDMAHIPYALLDRLRATPGFTPIRLPEPFGYEAITYNLRNPSAAFLADAHVRRALTDATPQTDIIRIVYKGLATPNYVPVPAEAAALRSQATRAGTLPVREDAALARQELDAAGWHPGPDGIRVKDSKRLSLTVMGNADGTTAAQVLQLIQPAWRAVGVEMRIETAPFDRLLALMSGPPDGWQAILQGITSGGLPSGSTEFATGGANNAGGYADATMDALIHRAETAPGVDALYAYQDYAAAQQAWTILPQGGFGLLVANRLGGADRFANPQGYWRPEMLFVKDGSCDAVAGPTRP